jgi:glutamate synthase (NADPH/NADH) large chain
MTAGRVLILGDTGRNFAAGMSGGIAYVYDLDAKLENNCNKEMVDLDECDEYDKKEIAELLRKHSTYTGSRKASFILEDLDNQLKNFIKVFPKDYKKVWMKSAQQVKLNES